MPERGWSTWQVLLSVLVAHLVNLESEINEGRNRHNRDATVIWHAKGPSALSVVRNVMHGAKIAKCCFARGRAGLFALFRLCDAYRWFWNFSCYIICFALSFISFFIRCIAKPYKAQWLLCVPPDLTHRNSTFCPHSLFMCFVWIWEQTAIISLCSISWLAFYNWDGVFTARYGLDLYI